MSLAAVNILNIGLMLLALAVAMFVPFETFLFAYAVLGPLHYLTQISWLHDRQCFTQNRRDWWPLLGLCALISATYLVAVTTRNTTAMHWSISLMVFAFGFALVLAFVKDTALRGAAAVVLAALALVTHGSYANTVLFGVFLPTVIHVFVFTAAFVLYGALKQRSTSAHLSFFVLVACGAAALLLDPGMLGYTASDYAREAYRDFGYVHATVARHVGLAPAATVAAAAGPTNAYFPFADFEQIFTDPVGVQVGRFIAFAYTYHYFNWFSKTKIIGWHEIPKLRLGAIIVIWIASVALYAIDYVLGLRWLVFLSFLHVLLEFPLDHRTIVGVGRELYARVRPAT